jgi:hypothetical protein
MGKNYIKQIRRQREKENTKKDREGREKRRRGRERW